MPNAFAAAFLELSDPVRNAELPRGLDLLTLVTSPDLAAHTSASPAQRLLMLAADGKPANDVLPPDRMMFHIGTERLPSGRPRLVVLRTGVRAGKSLIAAMALLHSALTCQFRREPNAEAGELPGPDGMIGIMKDEFVRALIVAPKLKMSRAPLLWIKGRMKNSPVLKKYIVKEREESIVIRRPDGAEVTIEIVAADSGGGNLRSTWLAGILFDEAAFHDGDDGVVNLSENYRAAAPRLLHGAQAWIVSSPWSDDDQFHKIFSMYYGKPGRQLAFHSDTRSMNPSLEQEVIDEERARDPDNAAREYDAIPLSSSSNRTRGGGEPRRRRGRPRHRPPREERRARPRAPDAPRPDRLHRRDAPVRAPPHRRAPEPHRGAPRRADRPGGRLRRDAQPGAGLPRRPEGSRSRDLRQAALSERHWP
jgi:hypothetical protein